MAKYEFDATIVFMAVAGEEQGLLGSTYFRRAGRSNKARDVEAMFTNDIIGSSRSAPMVFAMPRTVRVFPKGVPSNEKLRQRQPVRRSVGGENDSASRQLARFIKETAARYVPAMTRDDGLPA